MISKKDFFSRNVEPQTKVFIIIGAITCFICGALNIINIFSLGLFACVDILLFVGLGLGLLLSRSRACAIIAFVSFSLGKVFVILSGQISLVLIILTAFFSVGFIMGIIGAFNFNKEYTNYVNEFTQSNYADEERF